VSGSLGGCDEINNGDAVRLALDSTWIGHSTTSSVFIPEPSSSSTTDDRPEFQGQDPPSCADLLASNTSCTA